MTREGQNGFSAPHGLLAGSYATLLTRVVLGGVFLYAGTTKVIDPGSLAASIRTYGLGLPEWFVTFSAYSLPYLEVMLGIYLLVGLFTRASAWAANALMLLFTLALLQGALRGLEIDCGCFGASAGSAGGSSLWLDAARDVGLLALGLHIALSPPGRFTVDALLRRSRREASQS